MLDDARAAEVDRRATKPVATPSTPSPSTPPPGSLLEMQQLAGNRAVTSWLGQHPDTSQIVDRAPEQVERDNVATIQQHAADHRGTPLRRPGDHLALQRDFSQSWPVTDEDMVKERRMKVTGNVVVTADGTATSQSVARTMEFESGSGNNVEIVADLNFSWDELSKFWRYGDYAWRTPTGVLPFKYKAIWKGNAQDGAIDVTFVSGSNPKLELDFFGKTTLLYEAKPATDGDTATLNVVAYRNSQEMELTTKIKLKPPKPKSAPGPKFEARSLVVDAFPSGKATITAENLRKIEDFWYGLTPETRTAVQNNQLLNGQKVRITGHTDNTDKTPANFDLGYERARAVTDILIKLSGNTEATNFAPMTAGERETRTDDRGGEVEDPAQRKVTVELWEEQNIVSDLLRALEGVFGGPTP